MNLRVAPTALRAAIVAAALTAGIALVSVAALSASVTEGSLADGDRLANITMAAQLGTRPVAATTDRQGGPDADVPRLSVESGEPSTDGASGPIDEEAVPLTRIARQEASLAPSDPMVWAAAVSAFGLIAVGLPFIGLLRRRAERD